MDNAKTPATSDILELQLLRGYEAEMAVITDQMRKLRARRDALDSAAIGLRSVLRNLGIDPKVQVMSSAPPEGPDPLLMDTTPSPTDDVSALDLAVVHVLLSERPLGAKEIEKTINAEGSTVNYYTLSKSLNREAAKTNGRIVKVGKKFMPRSSNEPGSGETATGVAS